MATNCASITIKKYIIEYYIITYNKYTMASHHLNNDYAIVVARYNEDIQWLAPLYAKCVIYNKGPALGLNERFLPNVGRESDTYLHYIIDNYTNLPDYVVFTQARIADHRGSDNVDYLLKMLEEAKVHGKSIPPVNTAVDNNRCWQHDWNRCPHYGFYMSEHYKNNRHIVFEDWFKTHIRPTYPHPMFIYNNALFAVKKEHILAHPRQYYEALLQEGNHSSNPVEAHFFERSWYYIFDS